MKFGPDTESALSAAVSAGATFAEACSRAGVNVHTGRTWLRNGRKDPQGRYGALARAVDGQRHRRRSAERAITPGALSLSEAELLLAAAAREGSVSALKLWFDRHERQQPVPEADMADPLAELDELAAVRAARMGNRGSA